MIPALHRAAFLLLCIAFPAHADDPRAREIMQMVEDREDGDNRTSDMRMVLIDRKGNQRTREIQSYSKDFGEDTYRLMFFIQGDQRFFPLHDRL